MLRLAVCLLYSRGKYLEWVFNITACWLYSRGKYVKWVVTITACPLYSPWKYAKWVCNLTACPLYSCWKYVKWVGTLTACPLQSRGKYLDTQRVGGRVCSNCRFRFLEVQENLCLCCGFNPSGAVSQLLSYLNIILHFAPFLGCKVPFTPCLWWANFVFSTILCV